MTIPFDEGLGIHPQDDFFLDREVWDLSRTPHENFPLMLHYHPLVIYRFQVLKQADVVLAMFLHGDRFTPEQKKAELRVLRPDHHRRLDPVGRRAVDRGRRGRLPRRGDGLLPRRRCTSTWPTCTSNTVDGLHVASTGGVWSALVFGFAGMRDRNGRLSFDPRLPEDWTRAALPGRVARLAAAASS